MLKMGYWNIFGRNVASWMSGMIFATALSACKDESIALYRAFEMCSVLEIIYVTLEDTNMQMHHISSVKI